MYYNEPAKKIPVVLETDVLVLGSGPAGFAAAVSAARNGAKTAIVEQTGSIGGIATAGLMSHWTGHVHSGLYEEILNRSSDNKLRNTINPEILKEVMLNMLIEENVTIKLYTLASEPILSGNEIKGVIVESKSGREAIMAKIVIDASGDGDIAARAGVPYIKGRETDNKMQPMTMMFKIGGVDTEKAIFPGSFETNSDIPKGKVQDLAKENIPFPAGHALMYQTTLPGIVTCNMTNCIDVDGTNADDLTKAEITCRSQIKPIMKFLREYVPGYENAFVISSASLIGVRETRHFEGAETINEDDILKARVFDNWVVAGAYFNFDVHNISGAGLDKTGVQHHFKQDKGYTIPYGCLLPKKIDNLLLAGRNISGTHMAHSNYRVMPICVGMGHAAGTAAAMSVKTKTGLRSLNVSEIQKILIEQGVVL